MIDVFSSEYQKTVRRIKERYIKGARIRCLAMMDDPIPIENGSLGTVECVDDIGQIHVRWDNGRLLALVPNIDEFEAV